jgi:hypothetical protein
MTTSGLRPELTGVAGVPETALSEALVARLPRPLAPAPWTCQAQAVVWFLRGGAEATQALPPALRGSGRGVAVAGGLVRYSGTPVGAYDEVVGVVGGRTGIRPGGSVAFMAVDSAQSLVDGRANWALPKAWATFAGHVGDGQTLTATGADERRWQVTVLPSTYGPLLPLRTRAWCRQQRAGGELVTSRLRVRGRSRPALVRVGVSSDGPLPGWLRPGRHLGAIVEWAELTVDPPAFAPR